MYEGGSKTATLHKKQKKLNITALTFIKFEKNCMAYSVVNTNTAAYSEFHLSINIKCSLKWLNNYFARYAKSNMLPSGNIKMASVSYQTDLLNLIRNE